MDNQQIYNRTTLVNHYHLIGILDDYARQYPTDSRKRWELMDTLWMIASAQILSNLPIKIRYLEELYKHSINEGVTYLEPRKHLGSGDELLYVLDNSPEYEETNGKRYIDPDGQLEVEVTLEVVRNITALYPEFIGHKRIMYTQRQQPFATLEEDMARTRMLHERFPHHVIGYDVVGHEDAGNSHLYYVSEFLKFDDLDFYFHASETKWPEDLSASVNQDSDPVGAAQNIYEAVLLGAKRVGHGTGYLRHPYLLQLIEERNVAVEVCPVSGMVLGYFPDLRSHPGIYHFRNGGKVVLGSDDAGSFGFDHFTVDWYDVFMSWGLDLKDLRQLALNSLTQSAMNDTEKDDAINNKWQPLWIKYIEDTKTEACAADLATETPTFARLLPRYGPQTGNNVVHVFGRHFEWGICKDIKCFFGGVESTAAQYITNQHIACTAPGSADPSTVSVSVSFDGVEFDTEETYEYRADIEEITTTTTTQPPDIDAASNVKASCVLFALLAALIAQYA
jgi:adenosine deaminase CECR1